MLADPTVRRVVMTRDYKSLNDEEHLLFRSSVMAWLDLFELVFVAAEKRVLSEEQFEAWREGVCLVPEHWLTAFSESLDEGNYMEPVVKRVEECLAVPH